MGQHYTVPQRPRARWCEDPTRNPGGAAGRPCCTRRPRSRGTSRFAYLPALALSAAAIHLPCSFARSGPRSTPTRPRLLLLLLPLNPESPRHHLVGHLVNEAVCCFHDDLQHLGWHGPERIPREPDVDAAAGVDALSHFDPDPQELRSIPECLKDRVLLHLEPQLEGQAHRFAAAFLFPAKAFVQEVYALSTPALLPVKTRRGVSMQMMIRRARDLGLINQDRYERAFRDFSARGGRRREELDDEIPPEKPALLAKCITTLVDAKVITRDDILSRLPYGAAEVELLAGLPRGYLEGGDDFGQMVSFRASPPRRSVGPTEAKVIDFLEWYRKNPPK